MILYWPLFLVHKPFQNCVTGPRTAYDLNKTLMSPDSLRSAFVAFHYLSPSKAHIMRGGLLAVITASLSDRGLVHRRPYGCKQSSVPSVLVRMVKYDPSGPSEVGTSIFNKYDLSALINDIGYGLYTDEAV